MNILLLTYSYLPALGGVERSVFNLATLLSKRGHRVFVVTHRPSWFPLSVRKDEGLWVLRLNIPSQFRHDRRDRVERLLFDAVNRFVLTAMCRVLRVQTVHCHLINVDTRYAESIARRTGARVIVTLRGGETEHWITGRADRHEYVAQVLRSADSVTGVAQSLLDQAEAIAPGVLAKSRVVRNPVFLETSLGTSRDVSSGEIEEPYCLFAGRLAEMKDAACLIRAFHEVLRADPAFRLKLLVAGDGELKAEIEQVAQTGPACHQIQFVGRQNHEGTLRLIGDAEFLILPSCSSEGCPNVILEAMALETPVIVSSLPALKELVQDGVSGSVFPVGDHVELAAAIRGLAGDVDRRRRYAQAGLQVLATRHQPGQIVDIYEEIYRSAEAIRRS